MQKMLIEKSFDKSNIYNILILLHWKYNQINVVKM